MRTLLEKLSLAMHRFVAAIPVVFVFAGGCAFGVRPPVAPDDGAGVYAQACASCHGVDGRGGGPVATALRKRPSDLTRLAAANGGRFPRDRVVAVVAGEIEVNAHGPREMPVWSQRFSPSGAAGPAVASIYQRRHLEQLAAHIESIQRSD